MVKFKRRYYLIEDVETNMTESAPKAVFNAVCSKIGELFGDYGHAAVATKISRQPVNAPAGMIILRAPSEYAHMVDAALTFVNSIGGKSVQLRLMKRSSTIRSLYLFAWKEHNQRLQAEAAITNDPFIIETLAKTVGGAVPAHTKKRIWD